MKSISELGPLGSKRVLVRCDFNVPLDGSVITDDGRIRAALPTLHKLLSAGARVVVLAHLGRPDGKVTPEFSLRPVAVRLGELLGAPVQLAADVVGPSAQAMVASLGDGEIGLLENVRFEPAEQSKDAAVRGALAGQYAQLGDIFVSDGFGVVHRKEASVYDIAELLPHAAGELVYREVSVLQQVSRDPVRPLVVVMGGAKVSDKLAVIANLIPIADRLIIGGGMAFTFLAAQGFEVGKSLVDQDHIAVCRDYLDQAAAAGKEIALPTDIRVAPGLDFKTLELSGAVSVVPANAMPNDQIGLDIGPETERRFAELIAAAKTAFWNGPMGVFEVPALSGGTRAVAQALSQLDGCSVVGGGDSAAAVRELGFADDDFTHISTGGGASLKYLEGRELPGLAVLERE